MRKPKRPKSTPPTLPQTAANPRFASNYAAPLLLIVTGLCAYANTFDVPLVFDDLERIEANPDIRTLWPAWVPMATTNRPLGMYTFAINYAVHGYRVWGYHAANLAIHVAAALALLGIVRRTLRQSPRTESFQPAAAPLALAIALVWLVHPLQTESVTYIIQRLESLMSLCYLATLYCFVRAQQSSRNGWWQAAAIAVCALGMGTKEVMVTAPLVVLLYDRVFVAADWRAIFAARRGFYLCLTATWGVLAWSMLHWQGDYTSGLIGASDQLTPINYLLSQAGVIAHYLRLCFWPVGQCLDKDWPLAHGASEILPPLLLVGGLLLASAWARYRRPACGFLGACFFLLLAPTSSIVPIHDLAVEHRMYLASAVVIAAVVLAGYAAGQSLSTALGRYSRPARWIGACAAGGVALTLGVLTHQRNELYRSPLAIWQDTLDRSPQNARACCNLGEALCRAGRTTDALPLFAQAVELTPSYALAQFNLGTTLGQQGQFALAADHLLKAVELKPDYAEAYNNLGLAYCQQRQSLSGVGYLVKAVELQPDNGKFQNALGTALYDLGQFPAAIEHLRRAVDLIPADASAHYNLANALLSDKQSSAAATHYRQTLAIEPDFVLSPQVYYGLGMALDAVGEHGQAVVEFERAIALQPDYPAARRALRLAQSGSNDPQAAKLQR